MTVLKIATWNVNSLRVRLPHVLQWLAEAKPDILALQELKMPTEEFPAAEIAAAGYHAIVNGQKTYNGVAVLARDSLFSDVIMDLPGFEDHQRRVLAVTVLGVRVINLYVPNGESLVSEKYQYKLDWLSKLRPFLKDELAIHGRLVVLGDFNIAPDDRDVHDPREWAGHVLVSEAERQALRGVLLSGLRDSFREINPDEIAYSWWDYRLNAFKRNRGLRIDHILCSEALFAGCERCIIDKSVRGWERPSDHAPVWAEFRLD